MNNWKEVNESKVMYDWYKKTLNRLGRSKHLFKLFVGKEVEFKENKSFKSFFDRLEKRLFSLNEEDKQKIYWFVFVYLNQLKYLWKEVKSSWLTSIFDHSGIKYLLEILEDDKYKIKLKWMLKVLVDNNIKYSFVSWMMAWKWLPDKKELEKIRSLFLESM